MSEPRKKEQLFYYCGLLIQDINFTVIYIILNNDSTHLEKNGEIGHKDADLNILAHISPFCSLGYLCNQFQGLAEVCLEH